MKIWLNKKNDLNGGSFTTPFKYLDRMIIDKFNDHKITFPFNEIEIEFAYNSGRQENKKYNEWYEKLPIYYRGKSMIRVTIPVEKTLDDVETIFRLLNSAFKIILNKKKKTDEYNSQQVVNALSNLKEEMNQLDLYELETTYENILRQEQIETNLKDRQEREIAHIENKRLIKDIRLSDTFGDAGISSFMSYSLKFCNKVVIKLREAKFRLPNYDHLYIIASNTFENAIYKATRGSDWFVYGIAVLENYKNYAALKEEDKKRVVFELIKQGLHDIAKIDSLDISTLNKVLDETEKELLKQS